MASITDLDQILSTHSYVLNDEVNVGRLYVSRQSDDTRPAILVDTKLYELEPSEYAYVEYTSLQNQLMHNHGGLLRFLWDERSDVATEISLFLRDDVDSEALRIFGAERDTQHIDPTPPEHNFAVLFEEVFGGKALHALKAEESYFDRLGHRRYIDYTLSRSSGQIAIELNGESYHHPLLIGQKRYRSQLFKQNSLVADGYLVYRWSNRGMDDQFKFSDQLRLYFGSANEFVSNPAYRASRSLSSFQLFDHQKDAISRIRSDRETGKNTFLVVLPTGTGKTEVFIEDLKQQLESGAIKTVLVLVPTRALKDQMIARIGRHLPEVNCSDELADSSNSIWVQTNQSILRRYSGFQSDAFDYILVDEAHHAQAHGLRKVLEHFNPKTLIGLTATSERLDQRKLEEIFGSFEVDLTLAQAIEKGIVPPIRAFRLQSNIDLSEVRFNGKDYVKSDLNSKVQIPSRDQLIVDTIKKYFHEPLLPEKQASQGIIFCVDVQHTKRMTRLLNDNGLSAASVHAADRLGLEAYQNREIRFLCACELLNEGWDAPQTEIVVMARPTLSKVLYTQQLGRGTRHSLDSGKEALYVIDVVDNYGATLQPFSVHSLLNIGLYMPFGDVIQAETGTPSKETIVLDGLWEGERRLEPINIFNFDAEYGELLNDEQLARELYVSTGTVKSWVKKGEVVPDKTLPFGRKQLNYFNPEQLTAIREQKGLKERTIESRYDDFFEFLGQRDYTFSYKIVFILSFLKHLNERGEANLEDVAADYQGFFKRLFVRFGRVEPGNNPLNQPEILDDPKYLQSSLLQNPFEKFERKRFMYHCKDLAFISFDTALWSKLNKNDLNRITQQMQEDGVSYFRDRVEIDLETSDFEF